MAWHQNGSGYVPVPGDLVIFSGNGAGHVAIVNKISGSTVYVVEQNAGTSVLSPAEAAKTN